MEEENILRSAYLEHQRQGPWHRLVPRPFEVSAVSFRLDTRDVHNHKSWTACSVIVRLTAVYIATVFFR